MGASVMDRLKQHKLVNAAVLIAALALLSAAIVWLLANLISRPVEYTKLPQLPDLTGQPKVLAEYLQKLHENAFKSPMSDDTIGSLAMAYQGNFFYDEARQCLQRATELNPRQWRWVYYSALIDDELGDTRSTIAKLNQVLDLNPDVTQAWFRIGNAYLKTNSYGDAEQAFNKVLSLKEYVPETAAGTALSDKGAFPLTAYASYNLARAAFQQNKLEEAKRILEELVEKSPAFGPGYRLLSNVYQKLGNKEKQDENDIRAGDFESFIPPADPLYDEMILSSRNTAFLIKQFDIAARGENFDWTLRLLNQLVAINPNDGEILTKRMKLNLDMQMFATVDSLLPAFYRICGNDDTKLIDMAKYFVYRGQYEPAVTLLRRAITVNQKAMEAHILFVEILTQFKQYEMGINYCREIIPLDPKNAEIRNKLARLYVGRGDLQAARQEMETAYRLSKNDEERLLMQGRISRKEGSVESALDFYRKALAVNPQNGDAQLELGGYLAELRRWPEALAQYQNSLKTLPNNLDLLERYAWTLAVSPDGDSGNAGKALQLSARLALRRKLTKEQEMRCGITLAAAYARAGQFDRALEVAVKFVERAKTLRDGSFLQRLQEMVRMFQTRTPYTL